MRKEKFANIAKIIVFIVLFIILFNDLSLRYRDNIAHTKRNLGGFYAEPKNTLDVILIGTSASFSSFAPMDAWAQQGFTSYNFCVNVMLENAMPFAINEILKTQSPKVIVIDVAPFIYGHYTSEEKFVEEWAHYNTDGYKYSINRLNLINAIIPSDINRLEYYFDIVKYHTNSEPHTGISTGMKQENVDKGYNPLPWKGEQQMLFPNKTNEEQVLEGIQAQYFTDLLQRIEKENTNILFINQPIAYQDENQIKMVNYMKRRIKEHGFEFLDMSDYYKELNFDFQRDYSLDWLHFTISGAEKITYYLAKYLADNYELSNEYSTLVINRWDEEYTEWLQNKNKYMQELQEDFAE